MRSLDSELSLSGAFSPSERWFNKLARTALKLYVSHERLFSVASNGIACSGHYRTRMTRRGRLARGDGNGVYNGTRDTPGGPSERGPRDHCPTAVKSVVRSAAAVAGSWSARRAGPALRAALRTRGDRRWRVACRAGADCHWRAGDGRRQDRDCLLKRDRQPWIRERVREVCAARRGVVHGGSSHDAGIRARNRRRALHERNLY